MSSNTSRSRSAIKAIVFDFGGVIVPGVILTWVKDLDVTDPRYILFQEESHKWDLGELTIDEFYDALSNITGIPKNLIQKTFYEKATYYPEVVDLIKKLKKKYKIAIFSNNFAYNLHNYLDKLILRDLFDEFIISSDHKMKKPNPAFYQKMLDILNLKEYEIVFIDDSQENVDAANKLGIKALLFVDSNKLKQDLLSLGVVLT